MILGNYSFLTISVNALMDKLLRRACGGVGFLTQTVTDVPQNSATLVSCGNAGLWKPEVKGIENESQLKWHTRVFHHIKGRDLRPP